MTRALPRVTVGVLALGIVLGSALDARADDPIGPTTPAAMAAPSSAHGEPSPNHLRAAIEELGIMTAGAIQYSSATSNAVDWDLKYDWPSFRSKLTGDSVRFDTNHFDTNMITHPVAGSLYYVAARGNRLSVLESFLFATAASTLWEYVGEFREFVSINDLIVTPLSGMVVGETLTRLGVFFQRGRRSIFTGALGGLFAPSTTIHDLIDGTPTPRDPDVDGLGLTRAVGHRFELRGGVGVVDTSDKTRLVDGRFAVDTEVIDVEHFNAPGTLTTGFFDTGVSRLHAEGAVGGAGVRDLQLDFLVAPVGYYVHDLRRTGRDLLGDRFYVGATVGFDYGAHAYAAAESISAVSHEVDYIAGVHAAGVTAEYTKKGGVVSVRTALDLHPEFALVHALALADYGAQGGDPRRLPSVTASEGYYYALGAIVAPTVELTVDAWTLGAQARLESYWGIEARDRHQELIRDQAPTQDRRTLGRLYLSYAPLDALVTRMTLERRGREGEVADVATKRTEWALATTVGVRF